MSAEPVIDIGAVGRVVEGEPYAITREGIAAFADATSDPVAKCREGFLAPPVYAINPVLAAMVAAKNLAYPGFGFHGQHDFVFHGGLEPGMTLVPVAELIGVHQKSSGVAISVHIRSLVDGETVNEQHFVSFVPKGRIERDAGRPAPELPAVPDSAPDETARSPLQPDQTRRYAVAANDHDAYTTDEAVARRMGFPGLIVHGPLTVSLACGAIVTRICGGDPARLRRLAVRLSRPFYLTDGQALTTRMWRAGGDGRRGAFAAESREGDKVLSNGVAEVFA